ncbi:universal stress protein [Streptomyces sp. GSL17-111]|uniref:universal stress protein n=1 Tax=Streptomyces sp. GSL17-111 TaxID=3121596 RepID=UPI0030F42CB2
MSLSLAPHPAPPAPPPGRTSLPRPVAAVLTDHPDDVRVAELAARAATARGVPLLLISVLPPEPPRPVSDLDALAVLSRVLPTVGRARIGYIPAVYRPPEADVRPDRGLRAATGLLDLATRHRAPLVHASCGNPGGVDAHTLIEVTAARGVPTVRAVPRTVGPSSQRPTCPCGPAGAARYRADSPVLPPRTPSR